MRLGKRIGLGLMAAGFATQALTATAEPRSDGALKNGSIVETFLLSSPKGVSARILTDGALLQSFTVPDRKGKMADVELGDHVMVLRPGKAK